MPQIRTSGSLALAALLLAGCVGTAGQTVEVRGVGDADLLKMRAGPGLGYRIVLGLPDGTRLTRGSCVTEVGQLWCRVGLAKAPAVSGYVSADYLTGQ